MKINEMVALVAVTFFVGLLHAQTPGDPAGKATLEGLVRFEGEPPPARKIAVTTDAEACHHAAGEVQDVTVSGEKGLSGAVVEVRGVSEPAGGWKWIRPEGGFSIRQKDCRFQPSLLVIPDGDELVILNDDAVAHNINTGQWNVMQKGGSGEPTVQRVKYRGQPFVRVNCNIHAWMEAWLFVARSPYIAVTDAQGRFRIEGIPSGTYEVVAHHPTLRKKKAKGLVFNAGKTVEQNFTFGGR